MRRKKERKRTEILSTDVDELDLLLVEELEGDEEVVDLVNPHLRAAVGAAKFVLLVGDLG